MSLRKNLFTKYFIEILQVSLYNILSKFNGVTEKEYKTYKDNFLKKFELVKLPRWEHKNSKAKFFQYIA